MGIQSFLFIIIVSYHKHIYSLLNPHFWHSQCCHNNRHYELVDIALFTNCSISCCCYEPVVPFKNWNCFWLVHLLPHWLLWSGKGFGGEKQINQKRPRERLLSPAENRPSWLWQAQFYQATSNTFPAYPPPPFIAGERKISAFVLHEVSKESTLWFWGSQVSKPTTSIEAD